MSYINDLSVKLIGYLEKLLAAVTDKVEPGDLVQITGRPGEIPFFKEEGVPLSLEPSPLMTDLRVASSDAVIATFKLEEIDFGEVFNTWHRFSHDAAVHTQPSHPDELSAWSYDAATGTMRNTTNSASLIGCIGPAKFREYVMDVVLSSTHKDDDSIGICLAFVKVGGLECTLTAYVFLSDITGPRIEVVENLRNYAGGTRVLWRDTFSNMVVKNDAIPEPSGWLHPEIQQAGGIRIRAKRFLDGSLEVECLKPDGSSWAHQSKWTGTPSEMFRGEVQVGYMAASQANSTWRNIEFPTSKVDILDRRNNSVHRWSGNQWLPPMPAEEALSPGRLYRSTNPAENISYYMDLEGQLLILAWLR